MSCEKPPREPGGAAAAWPLAVRAQQRGRVRGIGVAGNRPGLRRVLLCSK
jgi:hypothetical protein